MGTYTPGRVEDSILKGDGKKVTDSTDFVRLPLRDALK